MDGILDDLDQAWLPVDFGQGTADFLIDTGFAGGLIIGEELFDPTQAIPAGEVISELAAGQQFVYSCFEISFEWFDVPVKIAALVGPGTECLIGTYLLSPHQLRIDYERRSVRLHRSKKW